MCLQKDRRHPIFIKYFCSHLRHSLKKNKNEGPWLTPPAPHPLCVDAIIKANCSLGRVCRLTKLENCRNQLEIITHEPCRSQRREFMPGHCLEGTLNTHTETHSLSSKTHKIVSVLAQEWWPACSIFAIATASILLYHFNYPLRDHTCLSLTH